MDREEIQALLSLSDDELFEKIGRSLGRGTFAGAGISRQAFVASGRAWLNDCKSSLCEALARSPSICDYATGRRSFDRMQLAAAVADVFFTVKNIVPVAVVATLVVKMGLIELCGEKCFQRILLE